MAVKGVLPAWDDRRLLSMVQDSAVWQRKNKELFVTGLVRVKTMLDELDVQEDVAELKNRYTLVPVVQRSRMAKPKRGSATGKTKKR